MLAGYLVNHPTGAPLVYLIVSATVFGVATLVAGYARDIYRALLSAGLGLLVVALLAH
jgi:hypothetical protein